MTQDTARHVTRRPQRLLLAAVALAATATSAFTANAAPPAPPQLPPPPAIPVPNPSPPVIPGVGPAAPPLPAQPGVPAASCSSPATRPSQWTLLSANTGQQQLAIDPRRPCLMYGTASPQSLSRSTNSGRSWSQVFLDTAQDVAVTDAACLSRCLTTFSASSLAVADSGAVWLSDWGNGDAAVSSDDQGTHWSLRDRGVDRQRVWSVAPSADGRTVYALVVGPAAAPYLGTPPDELFVTRDGGSSWSPATFPVSPVAASWATVQLALDPHDASHVWALASLGPPAGVGPVPANPNLRWHLFESTDAGAGWQDRGPLPEGSGFSLAVVRSARHPLRLLVAGTFGGTFTSRIGVSDDDGDSWRASAFPQQLPASTPYLAVDPADQDRLFVAEQSTGVLAMASSDDGLDTYKRVSNPSWWPCGPPIGGSCAAPSGPLNDTPLLSADDYGNFYLSVSVSCDSTSAPNCPGVAGPTFFAEYTVAAGQQGAISTPPGFSGAPGTPRALPQQATGCAIPVPPPLQGGPPSVAGVQSGAGTLTFDGRELLYTNVGEQVAPGTGVIHGLLPPSCAVAPDIDVAFSDADLAAWAQANNVSVDQTRRTLYVGDLAYDQRRNVIWASLGVSSVDDGGSKGLFVITVSPPAGGVRRAVARLAFLSGCGIALAYEYTRDRLWTCDSGPAVNAMPGTPSELDAGSGAVIPSCAMSIGSQYTETNDPQSPTGTGPSMWTMAAPDRLLVQSEDDTTLIAYDTSSCTPVATYAHRIASEAVQEDDQMACDTLTYGAGGSVGSSGPTGVIWIRDANALVMTPYPVPAMSCAMPTATTYSGPPTAAVGQDLRLCATLDQLYPGGTRQLAGVPISFAVQGAGSPQAVATALTAGGTGVACAAWAANLPPGHYRVTASFDPATAIPSRTTQFLPSAAAGDLTLTLRTLAPPIVTAPGAILQEAPPNPPSGSVPPQPQPVTAAQSQAAEQAQAQSQMQAQTQAQAQPHLQPGMTLQQRTRQQVAAQRTRRAERESDVLLAARRTPTPGPAALVAGIMALAVAALRVRPRSAPARRNPLPGNSPAKARHWADRGAAGSDLPWSM